MLLKGLYQRLNHELPNVRCITTTVALSVLRKSNSPDIKSPVLHGCSWSPIGLSSHCSSFRLFSNLSGICATTRSTVLRAPRGAVAPCVSSKFLYCSSSLAQMEELSSEVVSVHPYYGLLRISGDVRFVIIPDIEHQCGTVCRVRLLGAAADVRVRVEQEASVVQVEAVKHSDGYSSPVCEVKLPVKYDVDASLQRQGSIEITELQNESTSVTTQEGSFSTQKLQCLHLSYATNSGPLLIGRKLLGNLTASARDLLEISGDMIQAESVDMRAPAIECRLRGLHAKNLRVETDDAKLHLTDVTCDASSIEAQNADIAMGNCSGSLSWKLNSTTLEVAVPQLLRDSSITVGVGRVSLGCPAEYRYGFSANAPEVHVNSNFKDVNISASDDGMSLARAGPTSPMLSVSLEQGWCAVVPWTWPRTNH